MPFFRLPRFGRRHPTRRRSHALGQSIVELTLALPLLLLILVAAIDFGRLYFGWVNLNNAARIAANYAASNTSGPFTDPSEYYTTVTNDTTGINCTNLTLPPPTFSPDTNVGSTASVSMTCSFRLIAPFLGPIPLGATAVFPIRSGYIPGVPADPNPPCDAPKINVVSYLGMTVSQAKSAWSTATSGAGSFSPSNGHSNATVVGQIPLPDTCVSASSLMTVVYK